MLCVLLSAQFGVGGGEHRMREELSIEPGVTGRPRTPASMASLYRPSK
jgi:hypothetical protein